MRTSGTMVILMALSVLPGCGFSGGEALYFTGLFKPKMIDAEFKLTQTGAVVVLVDDLQEHCFWPQATIALAQAITDELVKHEAAVRFVSPTKVNQLRQSQSRYEDLSVQKIGKLLGAEQVLSVEVQSFDASLTADSASSAASMSASVKVINVLETEQRSKVRLWPGSPTGKTTRVEISASKVATAKSPNRVIKILTEDLAVEIAKSFYDRRPGDFE
jgi:hypothetical protein